MVAEVNGPRTDITVQETQSQRIDSNRANATTTAAPVALSDSVSLTDSSTKLQALEKAIAQVPEVDKSRVDALRQAVNSGTYKIDNASVADKLVSLETSLPLRSDG